MQTRLSRRLTSISNPQSLPVPATHVADFVLVRFTETLLQLPIQFLATSFVNLRAGLSKSCNHLDILLARQSHAASLEVRPQCRDMLNLFQKFLSSGLDDATAGDNPFRSTGDGAVVSAHVGLVKQVRHREQFSRGNGIGDPGQQVMAKRPLVLDELQFPDGGVDLHVEDQVGHRSQDEVPVGRSQVDAVEYVAESYFCCAGCIDW